ncbi:MAG: helix-turn-helix domain-containing protein [Spirosoma sp.]|nr:helix-turn-helix domain-containing protein [Spirosoma sp.]
MADIRKSRAVRAQTTLTDMRERDWLRPIEVQRLFGIGQTKLNYWIEKGAVRAYRPDGGRTVFLKRTEVENYIQTGQPVSQ